MSSRSYLWLLIALTACGSEAKPFPKPERAMSLPEPRIPIVVACPATVAGDPRCFLPDEERIALRSQVGIELQRIEDDFVSAWIEQPRLLWREAWFAYRLRRELVVRAIDPPAGITVPQAYQLVTEDVFRRLPALDDQALRAMYASTKATTREQMVRSIVDYLGDPRAKLPTQAPR